MGYGYPMVIYYMHIIISCIFISVWVNSNIFCYLPPFTYSITLPNIQIWDMVIPMLIYYGHKIISYLVISVLANSNIFCYISPFTYSIASPNIQLWDMVTIVAIQWPHTHIMYSYQCMCKNKKEIYIVCKIKLDSLYKYYHNYNVGYGYQC